MNLVPSGRTEGGFRLYTEDDVQRLTLVKQLKPLDFTLDEVRTLELQDQLNAQLLPGGGVAGAVHRAAGPGLAEECAAYAPIQPGQCVLTGGHHLPNPHVIHCLGPVYGMDEPADDLLASCYRTALELADQRGLDSAAFPAISTGAFGYPMQEAADTALSALAAAAPKLSSITRIRFVLFDKTALDIHTDALARVQPNS